jgi:hypothetical protein
MGGIHIKGEEEKMLRKGIATLDSYEVSEPADLWKWENSRKRKGLQSRAASY